MERVLCLDDGNMARQKAFGRKRHMEQRIEQE
jgi:hypothetical protein